MRANYFWMSVARVNPESQLFFKSWLENKEKEGYIIPYVFYSKSLYHLITHYKNIKLE